MAGRSDWLDGVLFCLASPLAYILGAVVVLAWFRPNWFGFSLPFERARLVVAGALAAGILARGVVKEAIVLIYDRARPSEVWLELEPLLEHSLGASLPSGHSIFFFTLATVIFYYHRRLGSGLYLGAGLIGLARVAAGVHWLSDVLLGAGLGVLIGVGAFKLLEWLWKRLKTSRSVGF